MAIELNTEEKNIIKNAFDLLPNPDNYHDLAKLKQRSQTGMDQLFDDNGNNAEESSLCFAANHYLESITTNQSPVLFDDKGEAMPAPRINEAKEVVRVCLVLEDYKNYLVSSLNQDKTDEQKRSMIQELRSVEPYLDDEDKRKFNNVIKRIGLNLPEIISEYVVNRRNNDYCTLQEMAKALKKDKDNAILKNKLTTSSRSFVFSYFEDVKKIVSPVHIAELGEKALKANSLIKSNPYDEAKKYTGTALYYDTQSRIHEVMLEAYRKTNNTAGINSSCVLKKRAEENAERARSYGYKAAEGNSL